MTRPSGGPPGSAPHLRLGRRGERVAARMLAIKGYRVLERNGTRAAGEADLLALAPDGRTLVLVEVKSRLVDPGRAAPPPEASVTREKQRRLVRIARSIAAGPRGRGRPIRIDVVGVDFQRGRCRPRAVRHREGAVRAR